MLAPQFVDRRATPATLAVGLGATLLAAGALGKLTASFTTLADAVISWRQVGAAARCAAPAGAARARRARRRADQPDRASRAAARSSPRRTSRSEFRDRADAVLHGCSFRIAAGDRIHLTGPSGGGKSTLVSLLTGLRVPDVRPAAARRPRSRDARLAAWRRRVAAAPQFHENHLFSETLAFNLLMGRRWPPTEDDLRWAEAVCRRLGSRRADRSHAGGAVSVVGETGWQLSHGERSRVFMARALLQGADLVVLDESFAELDPDSLQRCLPEAAELSKRLLVVAHA